MSGRHITVDLPPLAGSRERAQLLMAALPTDLAGVVVHLRCRSLIAATAAFADELVREIVVIRNADSLVIEEASDEEFLGYARDRAAIHGVADRVSVVNGGAPAHHGPDCSRRPSGEGVAHVG